MVAAVDAGPRARDAAAVAFAFGVVQMIVTMVRYANAVCVIAFFDRRLQQLPLTQEWVHYTSDGAKTAKRFGRGAIGLEALRIDAERRDVGDADWGPLSFSFGSGEEGCEMASSASAERLAAPLLDAPSEACDKSGIRHQRPPAAVGVAAAVPYALPQSDSTITSSSAALSSLPTSSSDDAPNPYRSGDSDSASSSSASSLLSATTSGVGSSSASVTPSLASLVSTDGDDFL